MPVYIHTHMRAHTCVCVLVAQLYLTLCDPMDCSPTKLLCPWNSPGKNTGVDPPPGDLPNPGIEPK